MVFSGLATGQEMRGLGILAQRVSFPAMEVQVFGLKKSPDTRKALRFFAERRIKVHFVDLAERAASIGELRRFAQKFGVETLLDRAGRRFQELGLAAARYGEDRWLEKLAEEPGLLRIPLVRHQQHLTIGSAEDIWKQWAGR
jgi:arsenate reductase-like glutaredoxin family protein